MARGGTTIGTVIRWDDERREGLIQAPELPGECWIGADVVVHSMEHGELRAGQVVQVDWTETGDDEHPIRALKVAPRTDLQMPGG